MFDISSSILNYSPDKFLDKILDKNTFSDSLCVYFPAGPQVKLSISILHLGQCGDKLTPALSSTAGNGHPFLLLDILKLAEQSTEIVWCYWLFQIEWSLAFKDLAGQMKYFKNYSLFYWAAGEKKPEWE